MNKKELKETLKEIEEERWRSIGAIIWFYIVLWIAIEFGFSFWFFFLGCIILSIIFKLSVNK